MRETESASKGFGSLFIQRKEKREKEIRGGRGF